MNKCKKCLIIVCCKTLAVISTSVIIRTIKKESFYALEDTAFVPRYICSVNYEHIFSV